MQRITVLAAFAAVLCIVMGRPGDVFPQAEVWENIDLHEVLKDLSEEAKQEWSKIGSNTEGTVAQRREAENGWAKKFGVENQWNEFLKKRERMVRETAALLERLPKVYEKYRETWKGEELPKNIEEKQNKLAAKYRKEFMVMNFAKELVERAEHKFKN